MIPLLGVGYFMSLYIFVSLFPGFVGMIFALLIGYLYGGIMPTLNKSITANVSEMLAFEK